jgi:hypothetical protein
VAVRAVEQHRAIGQHRVEVCERERQSRWIDIDDLEPQCAVSRALFEAQGHLGFDFREGEHFVGEAALAEIQRAFGRMSVGIDDAGQYQLAAQVDGAGRWPDKGAHRLVRADGDDGIAAKRQRLHDVAARILGVNTAVKQDDIRRQVRAGGGAGRGDSGQCEPRGNRRGLRCGHAPGALAAHSSVGSLSSTLPAPERTIRVRPAACGKICSA